MFVVHTPAPSPYRVSLAIEIASAHRMLLDAVVATSPDGADGGVSATDDVIALAVPEKAESPAALYARMSPGVLVFPSGTREVTIK